MPVKNIYLHVGLHKTGSSSIQNTLYCNRGILKVNGFIYPSCWGVNHSIPIYSAFCDEPDKYHMNIREGLTKEKINDRNKKYLSDLLDEVLNSKCNSLILSGEDITMLTVNNLLRLNTYLKSICGNIKVIVYTRHPLSWSSSIIQEKIKGGLTYEQSLIEILSIVTANFSHHIGKLIEVFGRKNVSVFQFENSIKYEFGLVGHFLSNINFPIDQIKKIEEHRNNESLSMISADIINFINKREPLIINGKLNEKRSNGDIYPLLNICGEKFDINNDDKKKIMDACKKDSEWLYHNFGINYKELLTHNMSDHKLLFTKEVIEDIKKAYVKVTPVLKDIIAMYLADNLANVEKSIS